MTKNPFDQFSKQYFEEFLSPLGEVRINYEIPGEPRFVDIWFTPSTDVTTAAQALGILARIAATPCLLEPFRKQPTEREIRSCMGKLIHLEAELHRQANRDEQTIPTDELPRLWIIATACSEKLLNKLMATEDETWLPGIYFPSKVFLTGIIAIDKLPQTPETLWLRILGKGLIQQQAITEVMALPKEDNRRSAIVKLLATWKVSIEVSGEMDAEARELVMNLSQAYLEWEQKTELRGVELGKEIGKEQERREIVENLLLARFGKL
ncbi:hypothetical protein, partial [Scytonema sp. NUACC26]|uniref:hypothetical protein n=1 Tax=Scytonema sp. NUACC26 TaxID=3140176 RepID=UPI0038B28E0A